MRITLMHNPGAGRQAMSPAALKKLLVAQGHEVRYQSAKEEGWKKALKKPADLVVIAGGDGTVARVTRRMVGRGVPVALLPSGTANNIARSLGLVERPFEELVRGWEGARRVKLDVGVVKGPFGERYFVEGIGAGVFADLLADPASDQEKKKRKANGGVDGALERLRKAAKRDKPLEVAARFDGKDVSGHYILFEAVNLRYVGPNLHLAADSKPGDGKLDLIMVTEAERDRLVHYFDTWQHNRERLAVLPTLRGSRLEMAWPGFPLHIDDKLYPRPKATRKEIAGPLKARLAGDAVEFLNPA